MAIATTQSAGQANVAASVIHRTVPHCTLPSVFGVERIWADFIGLLSGVGRHGGLHGRLLRHAGSGGLGVLGGGSHDFG
jgi:predicted secreted Zn-dependent protease